MDHLGMPTLVPAIDAGQLEQPLGPGGGPLGGGPLGGGPPDGQHVSSGHGQL